MRARQAQPVGVLIVDDSPVFRAAARSLIERRGYRVVGEAGGVLEGLAKAAELRPAAVLVDVRLADGCGFELAADLKRRLPCVAVLLTSSYDDGSSRARAETCGASGFVLKPSLADCDLASFWPTS